MKKLSFVIPCYRSENTVSRVIAEIADVMRGADYDYEIIPVNDCSPDNVWGVLVREAEASPLVRPVSLAKNMGRTSALMAGFSLASGDIVICLDDDGQCPVDRVFDLIRPIEEDRAEVSMAKYPVKKQSSFRNWGSELNALMASYLIEKPRDLQVSNFTAVSSLIIGEIIKYTGPYPYFSGLLLRSTSKICNVPMEERNRISGSTTYTMKKLVGTWMNGFTAFSVKPLRVSSAVGVCFSLIGFIYGFITILRKLIHWHTVSAGYSSLMALLLFSTGLILLMLGLIGEYLGRIYICINKSPQYVIEKKLNF